MTAKRAKRLQVTRSELARLIGCTPDRVTKYAAEGLPVAKIGGGRGRQTTFDLTKALPWLFNRRGSELEEQRTRYFSLQANRIHQDIRKRAGELVDVVDVERRWAAMVAATRERLLSLPSVALQRGLIASPAEDELIALVADALTDLSRRGNRAHVA
jgi:phage terminase Nu1 subunit (DNA packaging protein)